MRRLSAEDGGKELPANLEVGEGYVPVCGVVGVGAGHQQRVVLLQAADVLAVIGVGGGRVHICSVERGLVRPVVMDVHVIESEPVLSRRLVERVWHL